MAQPKISSYMVSSQAFDLYGSKHHQYPLITSKPYARYAKTTVGGISFKRLDPSDYSKIIEGLLISKEENFNPDTKVWTFDVNTDAVFIYSEAEDQYFKNQNASLISSGKLMQVSADVSNLDVGAKIKEEIDRIVNLPIDQFLGMIAATYDLDLLRRIGAGLNKGHSVLQHEAIKNRLDVLNNVNS